MNSKKLLSILQVNTSDLGGGAEKTTYNLFKELNRMGHESWFIVGRKRRADSDIIEIPKPPKKKNKSKLDLFLKKFIQKFDGKIDSIDEILKWQNAIFEGVPAIEKLLGIENFNFPESRKMLDLIPRRPDIIHLHNLHGDYFDLRYLPQLSKKNPLILNLHDAWPLSGHCAHSFDCVRWKTGCGHCPDLEIYPAIERDASAYNWQRKKSIFNRSRLLITTPSQWLMDKVKQSMLHGLDHRVIPNGIDHNIFHPQNKQAVRNMLGLPASAKIVLFVAKNVKHNRWKNYQMVEAVVRQVANQINQELICICLGSTGKTIEWGNAKMIFPGAITDDHQVALYYQAADLYIHASKIDTFPRTILEALSCGLPVVATYVGGIPEQIKQAETGYLVPPNDVTAMSYYVQKLLLDQPLQSNFSAAAYQDAQNRFTLDRQVNSFLNWYHEILETQRVAS